MEILTDFPRDKTERRESGWRSMFSDGNYTPGVARCFLCRKAVLAFRVLSIFSKLRYSNQLP